MSSKVFLCPSHSPHMCTLSYCRIPPPNAKHTESSWETHASTKAMWPWVKARRDNNCRPRNSKTENPAQQKLKNTQDFQKTELKRIWLQSSPQNKEDNVFLSFMISLWLRNGKGTAFVYTEKVRESTPHQSLELKRRGIVAQSLCEAKRQHASWNGRPKHRHLEIISVLECIPF